MKDYIIYKRKARKLQKISGAGLIAGAILALVLGEAGAALVIGGLGAWMLFSKSVLFC